MMMSHCLAARAARILAEAVFKTTSLSPSRVAISPARSTSEPMDLPDASRNSWGEFVTSEQTVSRPAATSSDLAGIVATIN